MTKILCKGKQAESLVRHLLGSGNGRGISTTAPPERSGRHRLKLQDRLLPEERRLKDAPMTLSVEGWPSLLKRMSSDPVLAADVAFQLRRPRRVDRTRFLLAGHSAAKEPMLNADPQSIRNGLNYKEQQSKTRLPKQRVVERIIVKPMSLKTAKLGYTSANWTQRLWQVWNLKYAKGFVIVTDMGMETPPFNSMGELKSAIRKSGWEIVA
jgi:hypothetical protein